MNILNLKLTRIILPLITTLLLLSTVPALAAPARVAILPFDINAEKDLTFLQEGILDMLGSRIAWRDKVEVINENETKAALAQVEGFEGESRALLVGGKLKADYVLFGSLTVIGESVSIDAKMVDVSGQQEPLPFFAQTSGMGQVIPQINQFATNINATVFGRGVARPPVAAAAAAGAVAATQSQPAPPVQESRMHPEKLLQSGVQTETQVPVAGQPYQTPNPAFVTEQGARAGSNTSWRSRSIKSLVTGIDIGDVDNDGRQEIVIAQNKLITINRVENGRLVKIAELGKTTNSLYVGLDVGDVDGNGTEEIYVSSLGGGKANIVNSFVIEHNGSAFESRYGPDNWFYRVAQTADQGTLLLGQRFRSGGESIFAEPIHRMNWEGGRIVAGQRLLRGGVANLMGATYGNVTHSGQSLVVAYSDWDRLRIYSGGGKEIWEDGDRTGGNLIYFSLRQLEAGEPNRQFFPLRVRTADIDRDGKPEVLIARHEELAKSMLKNFRKFKNGSMQLLAWEGMGLVPKWGTPTFDGRISDFVVGDFDNDGQDELVVVVVVKEGRIVFTEAVSRLMAFELDVP
ncbi:MAG: FG-GAP-like repeat-containing protein [Desulfosarcina sp.]